MKIIKPTTINRAADDLKTLVDWLEDFNARKARAELCQQSSVGLSDERLDDLVHEGKALNRAMNHLVKRWERKRNGR
jgi:hypothetical protein